MTDFNDNNRNNTPAAQPDPAPEAVQPAADGEIAGGSPAAEPAPAPETGSYAPEAAPEKPVPELTLDPAEVADRAEAVAAAVQDAEVPPAPEMPVPPAYGAAQQAPFTPPPAPQHPAYQQSYYQPPQYTQQAAPYQQAALYQPPQYTQAAPEQTPPTQPDPAENGGYQPPRYTQQYQPPYNEPQPPYQQPYASNPYGQQGYQPPYAAQKIYPQKSRIAAALLGILFGTFGVHNFYQGRIGVGVAQLAITVVSCGWLAVVSAIWGIVEGVQLLQGKKLVDGHGLPFID